MKQSSQQFLRAAIPIVLLIMIAAICYMSLAHLFGYYNDDWYLIYSGTSQGVQKFHDVFAIDRPFRGYFVGWTFQLFGLNPWLYSLGAFLMRCLSAIGMLWIVRIVWPTERKAAYVAALLFVVYPGFLDQPNALDYQSHLWCLALAILSIGCSLQAVTSSRISTKVVLIILSIVSQLSALLLMEYYIGLEGLRLMLIAYVIWKHSPAQPARRIWQVFLYYLPLFLSAIGFVFWFTQIFQVQRQAVNVETMFSNIAESPALRLVWMVIYMVKDLLNVILIAWAEPVYRYGFAERLKLLLPEFGLAIAAGGITWLALYLFKDRRIDENPPDNRSQIARDMAVIGLIAAAVALAPINFSNHQVTFEGFSRFSLPPSTGAALILAGSWLALQKSRLKNWLVVSLVTLAALAHIGNAMNYVNQWNVVRNFWWQTAWRAPQIAPGTVIMADYAGTGIAEDYFIWGPANLIYYPQLPYQKHTPLKLTAAPLEKSRLDAAVTQAKQASERRGFLSEIDFSNLLVLSLPDEASCVQAIDGSSPELSDQTRSEIMTIAAKSQITRISIDEPMTQPPAAIFGKEPAHGWCYYYEKASLARQRGDWDEVVQLGEVAAQLDFRPYDGIEWMPFVEAYAYAGQKDSVHNLATIIKDNPYYHYQACQEILADVYQMSERFPEGHTLLFNEFCLSSASGN